MRGRLALIEFTQGIMKTLLLGTLLLFGAEAVLACANFTGSGTKYNGEHTSAGHMSSIMRLRHFGDMDRHQDGGRIETELRGATDLNNRSDYSIALMYLGR